MFLEFQISVDPKDDRFLKSAAFGSNVFTVDVDVCPNPTCDCWHINLLLSCGPSEPPVRVECDLENRMIANVAQLRAEGNTLSDAEISEKCWETLEQAYCRKKQFHTERAVLEDLDATFPVEVLTGSMVSYHEILPYSNPVTFACGNEEWVIDDQYCVKLRCNCTDVVIHFIPKEPSAEMLVARYDYRKGTIRSASSDSPLTGAAKDLIATMKATIPDLDGILAKRHATLRRIYENSLERRKPAPAIVEKQPGRNDPCFCGSGKKFKKCCGA